MVKYRSRQIKKNEAKENSGSYGAWRKEFCRKYLESRFIISKKKYSIFKKQL